LPFGSVTGQDARAAGVRNAGEDAGTKDGDPRGVAGAAMRERLGGGSGDGRVGSVVAEESPAVSAQAANTAANNVIPNRRFS